MIRKFQWRPDREIRYVFLGCLPCPVPPIREKQLRRCEQIGAEGMVAISEEAAAGVFSTRSREEQPHLVGMYARLLEENDRESYLQNIRSLADASAEEVVGSVEIPSVAITGDEDTYAKPSNVAAFSKALRNAAPGVVYKNCGHMIFFEDPARLEASVRDFLRSL